VDEVFSRYLDPAFRYVRSQNPARVRSCQDALRDGLNCVALAHLVTRDLLLFASSVDGTNALWPLRRFSDYDRCRRIYVIRRLRQELWH
jgi:hypothetical protein